MRKAVAAASFALTVSLASMPVTAGTPYEEDMVCPIGGEKFKHTSTGSYSTFGARPDGKPYGSWIFPMPIPVCPSNLLPIYSKFTPQEIAKLEPLVGSAEYRAMATANKPYFNAAWLMEKSGAKPEVVAWMIVKASWEADEQPQLKRAYQQSYVTRIMALPETGDATDWLFYQVRAANGLRELSRFDEAAALIATLQPKAIALVAAAKAEPVKDNDKDRLESAEYLVSFLEKLAETSIARNPSSEPIAMLDPRSAKSMCEQKGGSLNEPDRVACNKLGFKPV